MNPLSILVCFCLSRLGSVESRMYSPYYIKNMDLGEKLAKASHEYIPYDIFNTSSPKCTIREENAVRCFFATGTNSVGYAVFSDRKLKGLWDYGGNVKDQPQVADFGKSGSVAFFIDERHHIVAMGIDTNLSFERTPTIIYQARFMEAPTCISLAEGTELFCLARGKGGFAKLLGFRNGTWEEPVKIGRNPNGPIGCAVDVLGSRIKCWASYGTNNAFSTLSWSSNGGVMHFRWIGYGEKSRGRPCVSQSPLYFPRALDYHTNSMVTPLERFNGDDVFSEPDCVRYDDSGDQAYDCFVLGKNGNVQRMTQLTYFIFFTRTSPWTSVSELSFKGNPSCVHHGLGGYYRCFLISRNNTLYQGLFQVVLN